MPIVRYMAQRGATPGPFFISKNGISLTKSHFVSSVREALMAIGLPYQLSAGHSFRIRAATAAAKAGLEDSTICSLGRWNSAAFLTYINSVRRTSSILPHPGALMIITIVYYQHSRCTNSVDLWGDGTPFFPWTDRPLIWLYTSPKDQKVTRKSVTCTYGNTGMYQVSEHCVYYVN